MRACLIILCLAVTAFGQRHKIETVDVQKPEGKLLHEAMLEEDAAKKAALFEQFAAQYPKDAGIAWVYEQLQGVYVKAGDSDKIIATGEKLLAVDPTDPEAALQSLKAAEAKKDAALVRKWSDVTSANARKMVNAPKPADASAAEDWKRDVDYARQVDTYSEYALFSAAVQSREPKTTIELMETLMQRNAQSEYAIKGRSALFVAYRQTGANDKALALAEQVLATDQSDEDMLLVVADSYLQKNKNPDKVHAYSTKIVEVMGSKPKPDGMSDADWTARRNLVLGLAHYMNGKLYYTEKRYTDTDRELRQALPLVGSNVNLKAEVLYELGFADYSLEKPQEAANFYRECAAIKSPYQATAAKNLQGLKTQYTGIK